MASQHIYGEVDGRTDLKDVFREIRDDVEQARDRADLTELHKRAGYLVTLTHSEAWKKKFEGGIADIRDAARDEFATTARAINRRADEIGTDADYDETWGD